MTMLRLEGISHRFGGLEVLRNIDFSVSERELIGLIGPNGAGKTTLFNVITGFVHPFAGKVHLRGKDVTGYPAHRLVRLGLARTFQGARVFANMSIAECLAVARRKRAADAMRVAELDEILGLLDLEKYMSDQASSLPSGLIRLLGIAMALSTGARLLLLDEPAAGLSAEETEVLQRSIRRLNQIGVTIVVVDHNLQFVMGLVSRAIVLDAGRLIADGPPHAVTAEPHVIEAYIGGSDLAED
ncbi:MAG TPA: ABC transporter ATP-binding protein [Steroidobacteraceae bacterium]|jgi:branched-chain amino acid transport system ATP-binding protein|nr:ABC transporter ATP-binding protein [Steroidobacteraceae bacterium]